MNRPIDLRSDTVTRPTTSMRQAIANAEVDDDVIDVDPTMERLHHRIAEILGKESAIFMPSGTMTNQIAIRIHCQPGDEFICDSNCHVFNYEQGAFAQLSGVVAKTIECQQGVITTDLLHDAIRPDNEHFVRTRLLSLENTHNRGGGNVLPWEKVEDVCDWASEHGLRKHLDGARLFNAVVASGISAKQWCSPFDTVSVCFSKGLGAPVGSILAGPADLIKVARRHRKLFGGGMRQGGIIAAAALFALENHVDRLTEDHDHAKILAEALGNAKGLSLPYGTPETNMLFADVDRDLGDAQFVTNKLKDHGILVLAVAPQRIRAVTHLDATKADIQTACRLIQQIF